MRAETQEWVDKAESDWDALNVIMTALKPSPADAACLHAQQCAEKYLKARLVEANVVFPKTHNLAALLALVLPTEPLWSALAPALVTLTPNGVDFRDPGDTATHQDAKDALKLCATVRAAARASL